MIDPRRILRGMLIFVLALLMFCGVIAAMKFFTVYHGG